jgi:hypothetical protein
VISVVTTVSWRQCRGKAAIGLFFLMCSSWQRLFAMPLFFFKEFVHQPFARIDVIQTAPFKQQSVMSAFRTPVFKNDAV